MTLLVRHSLGTGEADTARMVAAWWKSVPLLIRVDFPVHHSLPMVSCERQKSMLGMSIVVESWKIRSCCKWVLAAVAHRNWRVREQQLLVGVSAMLAVESSSSSC